MPCSNRHDSHDPSKRKLATGWWKLLGASAGRANRQIVKGWHTFIASGWTSVCSPCRPSTASATSRHPPLPCCLPTPSQSCSLIHLCPPSSSSVLPQLWRSSFQTSSGNWPGSRPGLHPAPATPLLDPHCCIGACWMGAAAARTWKSTASNSFKLLRKTTWERVPLNSPIPIPLRTAPSSTYSSAACTPPLQ